MEDLGMNKKEYGLFPDLDIDLDDYGIPQNDNNIEATKINSIADFLNSFPTPDYQREITWKPSIKIRDCSKHRGKSYILKEDHQLITKPLQRVQFEFCNGGSNFVRISERYKDPSYVNTPVTCKRQCPFNIDESGHGTVVGDESFVIEIKDNNGKQILKPGSSEPFPSVVLADLDKEDRSFFIIYRCRNTCDSHKKYNKERELLFEFIDAQRAPVCSQKFSVRVCESPRRDSKPPVKRRKSVPGAAAIKEEEINSSSVCSSDPQEDQYCVVHTISDSSPVLVSAGAEGQKRRLLSSVVKEEEFVPREIKVTLNSVRDENAVIQLVKNLGGEVYVRQ